MMTPETINTLAKGIYEQNKAVGWWDDPNRCPLQTLMLVITEIAEACEGDRKNLMDDKLPHRPMKEVELADTFIRLADMAGAYGWVMRDMDSLYSSAITLMDRKCKNTGARLLYLSTIVGEIGARIIRDCGPVALHRTYSRAMYVLLAIAEIEGMDLEGAITEKLEFNRHRADHKRENRAKEHGKKY